VNNDGYWTRASDYSIYLDVKGVFHIFPHDANETFGPSGGRGGMGGPMGPPPPGAQFGPPGGQGRGPGGPGGMMMGGATLDPLIGLNDTTKPLRSKLLAVPALRERYMAYVKQIATKWLDWNTLGPLAQKYQALIAADVKTDTRKLDSYEAFETGLTSLKGFADQRRAYLLGYKAQ
jgi:CotH kinase protein